MGGSARRDQLATLVIPGLNQEQHAAYQRDGFLVLEGFASPAECGELRTRAAEIIAAFDPAEALSVFTTREQARTADEYFLTSGDQIRCFFEEEAFDANGQLRQDKRLSINKIGHALHDLDPVFDRFSRRPTLQAIAAWLGYQAPLLLQSMYICKQPGIGGEVNCHQDASFLQTEPMSLTGFWFALEDATERNGCLWAIPGGHQGGLKQRWSRTTAGEMRMETLDASPWPLAELAPLEVATGSLIILHGLLPHLSYANRSNRSRHAYTLHLIEAASHYQPENWLQRAAKMPLRGFE